MYALELEKVSKQFGNFYANRDISFAVKKGEICAIVGENGAGKTTLMNTIFGLYEPSSGCVKVNGVQVNFKSSKDAIAAGIGMVHQHFMLVPTLTVWENIIAGKETGSSLFIDKKQAVSEIKALSEKFALKIDPESKVSALSVTMQQRIEILKILYRQADIMIFDEPTAVLTPQEISEFCEILLRLKREGKTILFISHKLDEVMKVADRIVVIRLGQVVSEHLVTEVDKQTLSAAMVGREVILGGGEHKAVSDKREVLAIKDLTYSNDNNIKKLNKLNLSVHKGEIMGIAGVDGNGQEELVRILAGLEKRYQGQVLLNNQDIATWDIRSIKAHGLAYIPEDRHKDGLVLAYSIADNLILGQHYTADITRHKFFIDKRKQGNLATKLIADFDIRPSKADSEAAALSGGNQQKIVIAREVNSNPEVILAVQPTRGLDVGAIEYIHKTLVKERNDGRAVLLLSLELDELLQLCDKIAVIFEGEIVGILDAASATKEELGLLMLGQKRLLQSQTGA